MHVMNDTYDEIPNLIINLKFTSLISAHYSFMFFFFFFFLFIFFLGILIVKEERSESTIDFYLCVNLTLKQ